MDWVCVSKKAAGFLLLLPMNIKNGNKMFSKEQLSHDRWIFQHDGAQCHMAEVITEWLKGWKFGSVVWKLHKSINQWKLNKSCVGETQDNKLEPRPRTQKTRTDRHQSGVWCRWWYSTIPEVNNDWQNKVGQPIGEWVCQWIDWIGWTPAYRLFQKFKARIQLDDFPHWKVCILQSFTPAFSSCDVSGMEEAHCDRTEFLSNYLTTVDDIILIPGSLGRIRSRYPSNLKCEWKVLFSLL